jgi:hypothetical protein
MITILQTKMQAKSASKKANSEELFYANTTFVPVSAKCISESVFITTNLVNPIRAKLINEDLHYANTAFNTIRSVINGDVVYCLDTVLCNVRLAASSESVSFGNFPVNRLVTSNSDIGNYSSFTKDRLLTSNSDVGNYTTFMHQNINTVNVPAAYFAGGGSPLTALIDCLTFATEVVNAQYATLSSTRASMVGIASSTKGYFGGGASTGKIDGMVFLTGTCALQSTLLSLVRDTMAGIGTVNTNGYFVGGNISGSSTGKIDRYTYATETCAAITATASIKGGPGYSSASKGFIKCGGYLSALTTNDGFDYASETKVVQSAALVARFRHSAFGSGVKGYVAGGNPTSGGNLRTIESFVYSSETNATNAAVLMNYPSMPSGANSTTIGYVAGGNTAAIQYTYEISRYVFATETCAASSATLTVGRQSIGSVSNK